jgi:hypothetical protein
MLYYLHYKLGVPAAMYSTGDCTWSDGILSFYQFHFDNPTTTTWDQMSLSTNNRAGTGNVAILMGFIGHSIDDI